MIQSLEVNNLFTLAKDSVKIDTEERRKDQPDILDVPLSVAEISVAILKGIDMESIEKEVEKFLETNKKSGH